MKQLGLENILKALKNPPSEKRKRLISEAYEFSKKAHTGQKRKSGEDYLATIKGGEEGREEEERKRLGGKLQRGGARRDPVIVGEKIGEEEAEFTNFAKEIWSHYIANYDAKPSDEIPFNVEEIKAQSGKSPEEIKAWLQDNKQTKYKIEKDTPYQLYKGDKFKSNEKTTKNNYLTPNRVKPIGNLYLINLGKGYFGLLKKDNVTPITGFDASKITKKELSSPNYNWGIPPEVAPSLLQDLFDKGIRAPGGRAKVTARTSEREEDEFASQLSKERGDIHQSLKGIGQEDARIRKGFADMLVTLKGGLRDKVRQAIKQAADPLLFLDDIEELINNPENFNYADVEDIDQDVDQGEFERLKDIKFYDFYRKLKTLYDKTTKKDVNQEIKAPIVSGIATGIEDRITQEGDVDLVRDIISEKDIQLQLGKIIGSQWFGTRFKKAVVEAAKKYPEISKIIKSDMLQIPIREPSSKEVPPIDVRGNLPREIPREPIDVRGRLPSPPINITGLPPVPLHLAPPERKGEPFTPIQGKPTGTQESFANYCNRRRLVELAGTGPAIYGAIKKSPDFNWWGAPESMIKPKKKKRTSKR